MKHTVPEAASMVGKDRRTLYRHMKRGRLSYGIESDGTRYIETSELMRVYGEIATPETTMSHPVTPQMSQGETANVTAQLLMELVQEVRGLREENRQQASRLEAIRKQLEDRPLLEDKSKVAAIQQKQNTIASETTPLKKATTFADILHNMRARDDLNN